MNQNTKYTFGMNYGTPQWYNKKKRKKIDSLLIWIKQNVCLIVCHHCLATKPVTSKRSETPQLSILTLYFLCCGNYLPLQLKLKQMILTSRSMYYAPPRTYIPTFPLLSLNFVCFASCPTTVLQSGRVQTVCSRISYYCALSWVPELAATT